MIDFLLVMSQYDDFFLLSQYDDFLLVSQYDDEPLGLCYWWTDVMCAQTKTLKLFHLFVSYASYLSCCQFCSDNIIVNLSDMAWADENLINSQSLRSVPKFG